MQEKRKKKKDMVNLQNRRQGQSTQHRFTTEQTRLAEPSHTIITLSSVIIPIMIIMTIKTDHHMFKENRTKITKFGLWPRLEHNTRLNVASLLFFHVISKLSFF